MGFTHNELLHVLPAAVAPFRIEKQSELVYQLHNEDTRRGAPWVVLTLAPQTSRTLAAITLPVTTVTLEFFGFNQTLFEQFMHRYKRYLHKGGG